MMKLLVCCSNVKWFGLNVHLLDSIFCICVSKWRTYDLTFTTKSCCTGAVWFGQHELLSKVRGKFLKRKSGAL